MPYLLAAERSFTFVMGVEGGYAHGGVPLRRFYAVDGAGRVHPLSERLRQRGSRLLRRSRISPPPEEPRELPE